MCSRNNVHGVLIIDASKLVAGAANCHLPLVAVIIHERYLYVCIIAGQDLERYCIKMHPAKTTMA